MKKFILPIMLAGLLLCGFKHNERTYIICDVINVTEDEFGTCLDCVMPNGNIEIYDVYDAPEGEISVVCFATYNQDDYTSYEIVALK